MLFTILGLNSFGSVLCGILLEGTYKGLLSEKIHLAPPTLDAYLCHKRRFSCRYLLMLKCTIPIFLLFFVLKKSMVTKF